MGRGGGRFSLLPVSTLEYFSQVPLPLGKAVTVLFRIQRVQIENTSSDRVLIGITEPKKSASSFCKSILASRVDDVANLLALQSLLQLPDSKRHSQNLRFRILSLHLGEVLC